MGKPKGKLVLARIGNPVNRMKTFAKRKTGLLKKAHELSVLCDVEIALMICSAKGKLYQFGSPNMEKPVIRYTQFWAPDQHFNQKSESIEELQMELENSQKAMGNLEKINRHMIGKEVDSLSSRELHRHEKQLEKGLRKIRSRKEKLLQQNLRSFTKQKQPCNDQNVVDPPINLRGTLCDDQPYGDEDESAKEHYPTHLIGCETSLDLRL